jgi:hypothetical protein
MSNVNLSATHQPLASGLKTHLMEWNGVKIGTHTHIHMLAELSAVGFSVLETNASDP